MANKKINQLVSKTAILSTDIFGIGDATTGQLFKKTIAELQAAIGGAVISVNGLVGTVVLDTDDIQELATPTNKYFTDARARGAISLTVTGNSGASTYSSGTGVLNVPTYTLAGLGGITASFLSGASGISYNSTTGVISYSGTVYTDASIRALLSGGTGISYNSTTGAISYNGTVYTDSSVRALISITTTGTSGASTYNNTTGVINVPNYTLAGLGGISLTSLSGGTGITYNNTTGAISYSGTVYTDASVRALLSATAPISYNNTTGVISITQSSTSANGFLSSTDWNTFNNKQSTITLTTTGTSGAATFSSNTLNIPNYGSALSGYLPLTGGTLTGALFGTSASFSSNVTVTDYLNVKKDGSDTAFSGSYLAVSNAANNVSWGWQLGASNKLSLWLYNGGPTSNFFNITTAGAATFSSSVTIEGNGSTIRSGNELRFNRADNAIYTRMYDAGSGAANGFIFDNTNGEGFHFKNTTTTLMRMNSAGNVGIGTSSPGEKLTINGGLGFQYSGTQNWHIVSNASNNLSFTRSGIADRMVITSDGNVGIGTTSPGRKLSIDGGASTQTWTGYQQGGTEKLVVGLDATGNPSFYGTQANDAIFYTNNAERIRFTSGGNILMGTSSDNGERLYVSGAIRATGTITANSDLTLKKNLLKIENALEKVEQINGYTYEFKENDSKRHAGVIAQEIQTVLPEIVNKGNDGILGVEYGNISALLIEAIKEQQTQINELKALLNK